MEVMIKTLALYSYFTSLTIHFCCVSDRLGATTSEAGICGLYQLIAILYLLNPT